MTNQTPEGLLFANGERKPQVIQWSTPPSADWSAPTGRSINVYSKRLARGLAWALNRWVAWLNR